MHNSIEYPFLLNALNYQFITYISEYISNDTFKKTLLYMYKDIGSKYINLENLAKKINFVEINNKDKVNKLFNNYKNKYISLILESELFVNG